MQPHSSPAALPPDPCELPFTWILLGAYTKRRASEVLTKTERLKPDAIPVLAYADRTRQFMMVETLVSDDVHVGVGRDND